MRNLLGVFILAPMFFASSAVLEIRLALGGSSPATRRRLLARHLQIHARFTLAWTRFEVRVEGEAHLAVLDQGALVVSNHLSVWDIFLLASRTAPIFLTTVETRNVPLLGRFARQGGCLFVEHRQPDDLLHEIDELAETLRGGQSVVLFPEGRCTDGSGMLPFRRSLFRAATATRKPVLPVVINYESIEGQPLADHNRDRVFYYGAFKFFPYLTRFLTTQKVRVTVSFLEPVDLSAGKLNHKAIAAACHERIASRYRPIPRPAVDRQAANRAA